MNVIPSKAQIAREGIFSHMLIAQKENMEMTS